MNTLKRGILAATLLCCGTAASAAADGDKAESDLSRLVDAYFEELLELNPTFATQIGDNRYNDRYANNIGPKWRDDTLTMEHRFLEALRGIDPALLSPASRLTYDIFKSARERDISTFRYPNHLLPLDQMGNAAADFAVFAPEEAFVVDARSLEHRHAICPYDGRELIGVVRAAYLAGARIDREVARGRLLTRRMEVAHAA